MSVHTAQPSVPSTVRTLIVQGGNEAGQGDAFTVTPSATLDILVDGGRTTGGRPSTLVDATVDPPLVLRAGAFAWPPA